MPPLRRSALISILAALFATLSTLPARAQKAWEAAIPMRDGVELKANIYLPGGKGPWPVILTRTPYAKDRGLRGAENLPERITPRTDINLPYLPHGYAQINQDCRGKFRSQGEFHPFMDDPIDGYDTVEWIAQQPWCDGNVGMIGGSAPGITAKMATLHAPPHLKCVVANKAFGSAYHYMAFHGGAFRMMTDFWLRGNGAAGWIDVIKEHNTYGDFWADADMRNHYPDVTAPILQVGGWWDIFAQSTVEDFVGAQNFGQGDALGHQKLIMHPQAHGGLAGELKFPNAGYPDPDPELRWFERWLKGVRNGIDEEPPASYYVLGDARDPKSPGNEWRMEAGWPPASRLTALYLQPDGKLSTRFPEWKESGSAYVYDPKDPVPTFGGANLNIPAGPMDQRAIGDRQDVLKFQTPPLDRAIEVIGKIDAELWAGSDAPDTDWIVKLIDVYPDGYEALIGEGALRARFREGFEREALLKPGEIYRFPIDMWSTALVFNKGHRIALHVTSSNKGRFEPNPNTGRPYGDTESRVARNKVFHDAFHPSRILLPVTKEYGGAMDPSRRKGLDPPAPAAAQNPGRSASASKSVVAR